MSNSSLKIFSSASRGLTETSWLQSHHSFSFGNYQDPSRMRFGFLRVFNDDWVAPSQGFGMHAHENMEIVTIVLQGELEHTDTMGHRFVLKEGDVQRMSAGKGIEHSEKNPSFTEKVHFLQIWISPQKKNAEPSYEQKHFSLQDHNDQLQTLVSPRPSQGVLKIHQEAIFSYGAFKEGSSYTFTLEDEENALFMFIVEGDVGLEGHLLTQGDSVEATEKTSFELLFKSKSKVLFIEMP